MYFYDKNDKLCVRCDNLNHIVKNCQNEILSTWKQFYLREMIFENATIQMNFAIANYDEFDDNVRSYDSYSIFEFTNSTEQFTFFSTTSISNISFVASNSNHFIEYEIIDFTIKSLTVFTKTKIVNVKYDEKSDSNKRPHVKKITTNQSQVSAQSTQNDRIKLKNSKKQNKKIEIASLIKMMNENTNVYDKSIFIRIILKINKIDLIWMKWLTFSSVACKELKRLCTKIFKKRTSKVKTFVTNQSAQQFNSQFLFQYSSQYFQQTQNWSMFQQFQISFQQSTMF